MTFPDQIIAGDTYTIPLTYSLYPASQGWTLDFYLSGTSILRATATANGDSYSLTIPSAKTSLLVPSTYSYSVTVTASSGERHTIDTGFIAVAANPATTTQNVPYPQKMFDLINCVLEGRITDDVEATSIAGRSLTSIPVEQLLVMRAQFARELRQLQSPGIRTISLRRACQ